ncbi:MAG: integrase [Ruminococcaceae bacterium]|nr:integrase [Oscillospiraceae bacterium]
MKITENLIWKFQKHLINEEKSNATIDKYLRDVRTFFLWTKGEEIDKQRVLAYKKHISEGFMPSSVNSIISSINSFFDFCNQPDMKVKILKIQKQIFRQKDKELTVEEYRRLLLAAKKRNNRKLYYLMQTICSCGIRVSELKFITVQALKERQTVIKCKGKMRLVMIPDKLCRVLLGYTKQEGIYCGSVFVTKSGKPLDRSAIWKMMKTLCESAGVERGKVFPHNLRHLFARTFYSLEKDIVRLADILGHSSINTTRIYTMEAV